jgi:hypothetical protein
MPARPIDNERKACDAIVRALEKLSGSARSNAFSPEDRGAAAPVEYVSRDIADVNRILGTTPGTVSWLFKN